MFASFVTDDIGVRPVYLSESLTFILLSLSDIYIIVLLFEVTCYYMVFEPFGFCCGGLVRVCEIGSHIAQAGLQFTMELRP